MNIKDLIDNSQQLSGYYFKQKLNKLVRENYKYRNLDKNNRKVVLDLVGKYSSNIKKGLGISSFAIRNEAYKLYQKRLKLGLTKDDLDDIKEILKLFKK